MTNIGPDFWVMELLFRNFRFNLSIDKLLAVKSSNNHLSLKVSWNKMDFANYWGMFLTFCLSIFMTKRQKSFVAIENNLEIIVYRLYFCYIKRVSLDLWLENINTIINNESAHINWYELVFHSKEGIIHQSYVL